MAKIEGLYTAIGSIINKHEDENRLAIDVADIIEEVKKEVDVYSAPLDWYIKFALRAAAEVGLYQKGYKSVVKGEGLFVNVDHCSKPEYLSKLFNNAKLSEKQKEQALLRIQKSIKVHNIEGQLSFDDDGTIIEDVTTQQVIEMLREDAKGNE